MASIITIITKVSRFTTDAGKLWPYSSCLFPIAICSRPHASSFRLAAGLEKTLRLLQGLSQIIIAYTTTPIDAAPWLQARKQFALGRRYLRFFKFVDAFAAASRSFSSSIGTTSVLGVGKWSCLGMYLFLESCTIMDAMGIWSTTWAPTLLLEANKLWFYSLLFSLASSLLQLYRLRFRSAPAGNPGSKAKGRVLSRPVAKQILTDACDLFIPGSISGWARTSPAIVGLATVVSTLLASEEIWYRVQKSTANASTTAIGNEKHVRRRGKV